MPILIAAVRVGIGRGIWFYPRIAPEDYGPVTGSEYGPLRSRPFQYVAAVRTHPHWTVVQYGGWSRV